MALRSSAAAVGLVKAVWAAVGYPDAGDGDVIERVVERSLLSRVQPHAKEVSVPAVDLLVGLVHDDERAVVVMLEGADLQGAPSIVLSNRKVDEVGGAACPLRQCDGKAGLPRAGRAIKQDVERGLSASVVQQRHKVLPILLREVAEEFPREGFSIEFLVEVLLKRSGVSTADKWKKMPVEIKVLLDAVQFAQT